MEPHLAHRLPWTSLAEFVKATRTDNNSIYKSTKPTEKQLKVVLHFARCLVDAVQEFAASDRASEEERRELDPKNWGLYARHPAWAELGYYDSVVMGYVQLNLLLTDATAFEPLYLRGEERQGNSTMNAMRGDNDGQHTESLAEHLQQAFNGGCLKPLTADVRQILRDHAAKLFRCMYNLLHPHDVLDVNLVAMRLLGFGWHRHVCLSCGTRGGTGFVLIDDNGVCPECKSR